MTLSIMAMDTGVVMLSVIYAECSYAQCH